MGAAGSGFVEHGRQAIQATVPGGLAVGDPAFERLESRRHELAAADAADLLAADQTDAFEMLDVLEHGGEREVERPGEVGDRGGSATEPLEDGAARRFGYGHQETIDGIRLKHTLNYGGHRPLVKSLLQC